MLRKQLRHACALFFALSYVLSTAALSREVARNSFHSEQHVSCPHSYQHGIFNMFAASTASACGPLACVAAGIHMLHTWCKSPEQSKIPYDGTQRCTTHEVMPERIDRAKARFIMHTGASSVYAQEYVLDDALCAFIADHNLNKAAYSSCNGTLIQHALHQESISLLSDAARLDSKTLPYAPDYQVILAGVVDTGRACAHSNMIDTACVTLDWACAFLRYARAVGNGIIDGMQHTAHTFTHPREFIAQLSKNAHDLVCITLRIFYECGLIETLIDVDSEALCEAYVKNRGAYINALGDHIKKYAAKLVQPAGVQKTVASTTHMLLTGKCLHAIGKFFSFASRNASRALSNIGNLVVEDQYAAVLAADGILVNAAQESVQIAFRAAEQKLPKEKVCSALSGYKSLSCEVDSLTQEFSQWMRKKHKTLIHLFEGEMGKDGGLAGLHHDYLGYLEAQGRVHPIKQLANGMYRAKVDYNGRFIDKSFFPRNWTRRTVIDEITGLIKQPSCLENDGMRIVITGYIDQMEVIVVLTQDYKIVTAYPNIKLR